MRDEKRISRICRLLEEEWKKVPDWRFFQLIDNIMRFAGCGDCFYVEDDECEKIIRAFFDDDSQDEPNRFYD